MGKNGCGKSTLFRLIAGFEKPAAGRVELAGQDPAGLKPKARARLAAYLPQRFGVFFDTDVEDVVLMGTNPELGALESPGRKQRQRALEALELLGIGRLAGRNFAQLSEGQKQMVMLARCIIQKAPLLLFDEPDSALDVENRQHMMDALQRLVQERERGALLILHDQQLALSCCDKIFLMQDGAVSGLIQRDGATAESVQAQMEKVFGRVQVRQVEGAFYMGYAREE